MNSSQKILFLLLLCVVFFAGCVTGTPFRKSDTAQDKSLLYVFRPESLLSRGTQTRVTVNGETRGVLINKSYIAVQANPGVNAIALETNDFIHNTIDTLALETKAGQAYFIKAEPGLLGAFELMVLDEETGMREISATDFYETR